MKRIVKSVARALWRMTTPVRRPIAARFDARVSKLIAGAIDARMMPPIADALDIASARLERIERTIGHADLAAANMVQEMDLVLNGLTREVFRLQAQVERLQRGLGDSGRSAHSGLSILGESGDEAPSYRVADHARVG